MKSILVGNPLPGRAIAVIIVCKNAAARVAATVNSVFALRDDRLRVYVVDGGSADGTDDYLRSIEPRLAQWTSEADTGIYDAMNKGWAMCSVEDYVLFLGAGDRLLELPSTDELAFAERQGQSVVIGSCHLGNAVFVSRWTTMMRIHNTVHHQAQLVLKHLSPGPPFDAKLRLYGDWDFNLRLRGRGVRAYASSHFASSAEPHGASSVPDLDEIERVCARYSGTLVAWIGRRLVKLALRRNALRGR